jgi:outer membrane protein TolC
MKFDLQRRVLDAWLEHALTAEKIRLQRETAALAALSARSAAGRVEGGASGRDLLQAEVDAALADDELARLEATLRGQRAQLNALVGRRPDASLDPPSALPAPRPIPADDARLLAAAAESPELAALAHATKAREHALDFAKQQFIPDFNPFGGFTGSMEQVAGIVVSLPARIPMLLGAVRESRALLARAEATAEQARLDREAAFVAALAALRDHERQVALLEGRVLPAVTRTLESTRGGYSAGALGFTDLAAGERLVLELRGLVAEARIARERRLAELEALAGFDVETLSTSADPGARPRASS